MSRVASTRLPSGALFVEPGKDGTPYWAVKWRIGGDQIKRRLGGAWVERGDSATAGRRKTRSDGWIKRRGRPPHGYLSEDEAVQKMPGVIEAVTDQRQRLEAETAAQAQREVLFEDVAAAYLEHRATVKRLKPSTLRDYESMIGGLDTPARKRGRAPKARIMRAFAGRPMKAIGPADVNVFLRDLDRDPAVGPRSVNKHRQLLNAIWRFAGRKDTFGIPWNPVSETEKRREEDSAEIITYTASEVLAIAQAARRGAHRDPSRPYTTTDERIARSLEDDQDGCIIEVAAFCGLRQGELRALRWRDINWDGQRLHVQRAISGVEVGSTKSRKSRTVPIADQPLQALAQLSQRPYFVGGNDLVFCSRTGGGLDGSALRRRYKKARDATQAENPDMPSLTFHELRHTFGTLAATRFDLVNVQAMMGHGDPRTTSRYLHARPASHDASTLSEIFRGDGSPEAIISLADAQ